MSDITLMDSETIVGLLQDSNYTHLFHNEKAIDYIIELDLPDQDFVRLVLLVLILDKKYTTYLLHQLLKAKCARGLQIALDYTTHHFDDKTTFNYYP